MVKIREITARTILRKTRIPGADYSINHYSGCTHACIYCYARFICKWRKGEKWGEFIDVKTNAPDLITKESKNKKGTVILCTTADPYQPIERKYELTRRVLQNLNKEMKPCVLTKSDLILRDADVFKTFKHCELGLTITTLNNKVKKVFEPFSSPPSARLKALKTLKKQGFKTFAFIGPILPYLTNLERIFKRVSPFADTLMFEDLNMNPAKKQILEAIKKNFPDLLHAYENLSKEYWREKEKQINHLSKEFNQPIKIYFKHTGSLKFK